MPVAPDNLTPEQVERTKKYRLTSRAILVLTGAVWVVWDIFPAINVGRGDTLSENIRDWSRSVWLIPYMFGALIGHFFLNFGQPDWYRAGFMWFTGVTLFMLAANIITYMLLGEVQLIARIAALCVGCALGTILWTQDA